MWNDLIKLSNTFITMELENNYFVFDGEKNALLKVPKLIFDIVGLIKKYDISNSLGLERVKECLKVNYTDIEIEEAIEKIKGYMSKGYFIANGDIYDAYQKAYNMPEKDSYKGGLWLNLAHSCNLNCRYCYADGGNYQAHSQIMSKEIAKKCVEYWYAHIDKNKKFFEVVFFGGEPLINQEVFFEVIEQVNKKVKSINAEVRYTMATNGTIINDKILDVIKNNNFNLSISIDGLKHIHNKNRPYATGKGSYDDVLCNILRFQEVRPNLIVNMVVVKKDIGLVKESVEELWNKGIEKVNIAICMDKNEKLDYETLQVWQEQVRELSEITVDNILNRKQRYLNNIYQMIMELKSEDIELAKCSLFNNGVFVFAPNGDVYKCHRNVGREEYKIANINDKDLNLLGYRIKRDRSEECEQCWAKKMCDYGCPYEHELYTGDSNKIAKEWCDKTKIMQKEAIRACARLFIQMNMSKNEKGE